MMHEFLYANRTDLIERCRAAVALRPGRLATKEQLNHGVPRFLDQIIKTLRIEETTDPLQSRKVSGPTGGGDEDTYSEIGDTAAEHGWELLQLGYSVDQVVHDYGDLCQAITSLAVELDKPFKNDEFRTLNRCLDNGIADAVREFSLQRDFVIADEQALDANAKIASLVRELRIFLNAAILARSAIKTSDAGLSGATAEILDQSLLSMRTLLDRSVGEVQLAIHISPEHRLFSLAPFITEVRNAAAFEAQVRQCVLTVSAVDPLLAVYGTRELLVSGVGNLLQNAFKFTAPHSEITLSAYAAGDRIFIDIESHGPTVLSGDLEEISQLANENAIVGTNLESSLSIVRRSIEINHGKLTIRDYPGSGCLYTVDLPRHATQEKYYDA